jgi:hypothetical protein
MPGYTFLVGYWCSINQAGIFSPPVHTCAVATETPPVIVRLLLVLILSQYDCGFKAQ